MTTKAWRVVAGVCAVAASILWALPAGAQKAEVKEKPPMYSYVGFWSIPRAQWGEMEKANTADQQILQKALASGTIIGYGNDVNLVHSAEGATHDDWWSSMSLAELLNVLDQFYKSGSSATPVLTSATRHWDDILVSRDYNWHSGSWKDAYTYAASWKLKHDAPEDAVETLSKNALVPMLEKLLADGTIHEYEIDTEAIHTEDPGTFWIFYLATTAEALDKVRAVLLETLKANPLMGPAFGSMVEQKHHRDYLVRTNATYK